MRIDPDPPPGTISGSHSQLFLKLFGLPFFCVGLAVMAGYFGAYEVKMEDGGPMPLWFALIFLFTFGGIGLGLMIHGRGFVIDSQAGTVLTWRRVLLRFGKVRQLSAFDEVRILRRVIRGDRSTRTVFPVQLAKGRDELDLLLSPGFEQARQMAEAVARHLRWPLVDRSGDEDRRREFEDLDKSYRDRIAESGGPPPLPEPPRSKRMQLEVVGEDVVLHIAPPGMSTGHLAAMLFALGGVAFVLIPMGFFLHDAPAAMQAVAYTIFASPAFVLLLFVLQHSRRGWRLEIDRDELVIHHLGFPGRVERFALDEIEDLGGDGPQGRSNPILAIGRRNAVTIYTDRRLVSIGGGLDKPEGEFLRAFLESTLAAPPR